MNQLYFNKNTDKVGFHMHYPSPGVWADPCSLVFTRDLAEAGAMKTLLADAVSPSEA